jgi:hypothetical protein
MAFLRPASPDQKISRFPIPLSLQAVKFSSLKRPPSASWTSFFFVIALEGQCVFVNLARNTPLICMHSMGTYIRVAQQNITSIAKELSQKAQHDLRFALVCYRDHPPAESSYATRVFEFTSSLDDMNRNVGTMKAQGGGDTPESVACALHAALRLPWRPNSVKVRLVHKHQLLQTQLFDIL